MSALRALNWVSVDAVGRLRRHGRHRGPSPNGSLPRPTPQHQRLPRRRPPYASPRSESTYRRLRHRPPATRHGPRLHIPLHRDETGISNAIIDPQLYEQHRSLVTYARFLLVEGTLQNVDKVIHIRARHIEELNVTAAPTQSHDFH
jgi:hypothetical protein